MVDLCFIAFTFKWSESHVFKIDSVEKLPTGQPRMAVMVSKISIAKKFRTQIVSRIAVMISWS